MNRLQSYLVRAGKDLDLRVVVPFSLDLGEGLILSAQALFPELGAARGMIIVSSQDELIGAVNELVGIGYGYSVISELPLSEKYDVDDYIELFSDWGWGSGEAGKPDWMIG